MARHFLELAGAATVPTEPFLLTRRAVVDLHEAGAMGASQESVSNWGQALPAGGSSRVSWRNLLPCGAH
jgi:hypothetical protein